MARIIVQKGGVGGGRLECDGKGHWWIVPDHQALGVREKTPCGRCMNPEACRQQAALLEKQEQEEAEKKAAPPANKG